jgi:hypothetical protein
MIPISTTTVTVESQTEAEPGEGITTAPRVSGVRAVISTPSGSELPAPGGGAERIDALLLSDPIVGMAHTDKVTADGVVYEVAWVAQRDGFGLAHTTAGLVVKAGH